MQIRHKKNPRYINHSQTHSRAHGLVVARPGFASLLGVTEIGNVSLAVITGAKAPSRSLSLELRQALWSEAPISSKKKCSVTQDNLRSDGGGVGINTD